MEYTAKKLDKSQVELQIIVVPSEYGKEMIDAAVRLSERAAIKGFRPGKAPYEMVKQSVGEIKILEEAMQNIVEKNYSIAIKKEGLQTVGMPEITVLKAAPGNNFEFKAICSLIPAVKLANINKIEVKSNVKKISEDDVEKVLIDLRKMQTKEVLKNNVACLEDKIVVDMDMFINNVPMEGGQTKNHQVYLNEPYYIAGFTEQLVGLKKDDNKEFTLKFPKEHYQKHLAGKDVNFKIKVKDVYSLELPILDDSFAKSLGQEGVGGLKKIIEDNLVKDAENKDAQRVEVEILEKIVEASEFDEIPLVLINSEKHKMFHELKAGLEKQGIELNKYLQDLKKTEEEIYKDFTEQATKRVKAALVSRQIALENNLKAEKEDVDKELELIKKAYPNDKSIEDKLKRPEVLETVAVMVQNRKVVAWLKEKILK